MLSAAIDVWFLLATMFFEAFLPAPKPVVTTFVTPAAQRIRRKRKIVRSKRATNKAGSFCKISEG